MDETRKFGECECCGNEVNDTCGEYFVDSEGRVYCSVECVLETYGVTKLEV